MVLISFSVEIKLFIGKVLFISMTGYSLCTRQGVYLNRELWQLKGYLTISTISGASWREIITTWTRRALSKGLNRYHLHGLKMLGERGGGMGRKCIFAV